MTSFLDASTSWQLLFQDPATPVMEGIVEFHHDLLFYLVFVVFFVLFMMGTAVEGFTDRGSTPLESFSHNTTLEIVWTIVPSLVLALVAAPSFALLYSIDEIREAQVTLKAVGHQWYWTYEYGDPQDLVGLTYFKRLERGLNSGEDTIENMLDDMLRDEIRAAYGLGPGLRPGERPAPVIAPVTGNFTLESFMVNDPGPHDLRLLDVTSRVVLPRLAHVRALVTSHDVLHSWAVPSLGVKVDACPGRLNQAAIFIKRPGVYYGQCSEICGVNHGFMPICVEAVDMPTYNLWFQSRGDMDMRLAKEILYEPLVGPLP